MDKSFQILVQEHSEMLFCYALSLCGDRDMAEDASQEAFLVAYRRMDDFDSSRDFGAWLRGIVRNVLRSEKRKSARLVLMDMEYAHAAIENSFATAEPDRRSVTGELLEALRKCLETLDTHTRRMFELFYAEQAQAADIAASFGLTVETVWKRISRGRKALKVCIGHRLEKQRK